MNHIQVFVHEFYEYNKKEFWLLVAGNIALGFAINYLPLHEFLQAGVVIIMALKTFSFVRSASIMPSISSDFDRYSWKYFQGLPLSKRELIISLVLSNVFVMFPLLVWLMSFFPQVAGLFIDENKKVDIQIPVKIFLAAVPIMFLISTNALSNQIQFPRKQYSKIPAKVRFLNTLKVGSLTLAVMLYGFFLYDVVSDYFGFALAPYVKEVFKFAGTVIKSWWLSPLIFWVAYASYSGTLYVWQNEKKSYSDIKWIPKRDIPLTAFAFILLAAPIVTVDWKLPGIYSDSELLSATFYRDYKKIDSLIRSGHDINKPNFNGISPLMAAALQGDDFTYTTLLSYGAKAEGKVNLGKTDYRTGMNIFHLAVEGKNLKIIEDLIKKGFSVNEKNPISGSAAIHYASRSCSSEVVDLLIEKKVDLSVVNKHKQTALHLAAKRSCFNVVSSLLEKGIDHTAKDDSGKMAIDYLKDNKYNKELAYYVNKKTRAPASIKK